MKIKDLPKIERPREKRTIAVQVRLEGGGHIDYVHMQSDRKIGECLQTGDKIGYISDGNSGHFKKIWTAWPYFYSPQGKRNQFFTPQGERSISKCI